MNRHEKIQYLKSLASRKGPIRDFSKCEIWFVDEKGNYTSEDSKISLTKDEMSAKNKREGIKEEDCITFK